MCNPSRVFAFLIVLMLHPVAAGAQLQKADVPFPSQSVSDYELAARGFTSVETTGAGSDIEIVRNEQPVIIERPASIAPGQFCTADANYRQLGSVVTH